MVENKLQNLGITSNDYSSRIDNSKKIKFRKGVPTKIRAEFFIQKLTEEEKGRLTMNVEDGEGNTIPDTVKGISSITFIPKNSKATYVVKAKYITESGEIIEKELTGESEGNVVMAISHSAEVVRPGTAMSFSVTKMRFNIGEDEYKLTPEESSEIKWNLNNVQIGTGSSINIPGNKLLTVGKYVVEAFSMTANAGKKHEEDDWHFEVKQNDVVSFSLSGTPKVGKPITATVDKMVFADLLANEIIHWSAPLMNGTGKSIKVTPTITGKFSVTCKINNQKGTTQEIDVLEAKITNGFWHDLQGNEISKATWGQKVLYSLGGENLKGENIKAKVIDKDMVSGNDFAADKNFAFGDAAFTNFALLLDKNVQDNTTSKLTPDASLFVKAQIVDIEKIQKEVPAKKGTQQYLNVSSKHSVYRALIGDADGKQRHNPVDYDMKSFVYANSTYPKGSKLTVKIFEDKNWAIDPETKELVNSGAVKEDGTLVTTIDWGKLKDAKQNKKTKTYYAKIYDDKDDEVFDGSDSDTLCNAILIPQSILKKQVGYTGAVLVGSEEVQLQSNGECVCKQYDLVWGNKVSCAFRKKVIEISKKLKLPQEKNEGANWLMTIMALESAYTFSPKIGTFGKNPDESKKNSYVGLIQFGGDAASDIGITRTDLMALTAEKQLDYVEKYYLQKKFEKLLISRTALYLAVNYPNSTKFAADKNHVVYDSSKAAYDSNDLFKKEKHEYKIVNGKKVFPDDVVGSTYVWEMEQALEEIGNSGKSNKATDFECGKSNNEGTEINAKDIITYHIFSDGKIEKHIPKVIKEEYKQKYKYVYHDKDDKEHEICIADWHTTTKKLPSKKKLYSKPTHSKILSDNNISEGQTKRRVKYENGDIAEYGSNDGDTFWRLYTSTSENIELVEMPESTKYAKYRFSGTKRRFTGPNYFAGFIGALAKTGLSVTTTGSCFREGSCFPSQLHVNGESVDTIYFWNLKDDQMFVDAMKSFHFGEVKVGSFKGKHSKYFLSLKDVSDGGTLHNSHFHSGEFDNSKIKIKRQ